MKTYDSLSSRRGAQAGVMLIEALIALLIFSIGVLGLIGLQSSAAKLSGDARYRSEAALFANELVGQMWVSDRTAATLQAAFDSSVNGGQGGSAYQIWAYQGANTTPAGTTTAPASGTVLKTLPGAQANPPIVTVTPVSRTVAAAGGVVTVTTAQVRIKVRWQAPQENGDSSVHSYDLVAQIGG